MSQQHHTNQPYDVLVVGSGIAGLSAAASALQTGASVILLERSVRKERGGNTRWTEALMRMKSETEVSDDFEEHFAENSGYYLDPGLLSEVAKHSFENWSAPVRVLGFTDPEVIATLASEAGPTIQWLKTFGVRFDMLPTYFITACQPRLSPVGGGLALVEALGTWVETNGAEVLYETTARRLLQDDDGVVIGVSATNTQGRSITLRATSTILACGGFEGNPEMLARYVGPRARYVRPVARGGYYNRGEGFDYGAEYRRSAQWRL